MFKRLKHIIDKKAFVLFVFYFARLYCLSFRLTIVNEKRWQGLLKQGHTVLLCGWHQQFFAVIRHFKNYAEFNPGLMISQSRDGSLIAGVANLTGWHTPRGSSSRDGKKALDEMINHLRQFRFGLHILDGPRGPIGKIKPGVIKMSNETGAFLVPFYISSDSAWFFNSWDRFMLPKPFAGVRLEFDEPILFDLAKTHDEFENQRCFLERRMSPALFL